MGKERLTPDLMALRVARDLRAGMVVNLGIGLPTRVAHYGWDRGAIFVAENGAIRYGPYPEPGQEDPDLVNAGGEFVTLLPGASFVHHADAFALIRGGRLDLAVLGAYQVSERGDLANWALPGRGLGNVGGAADIAYGARRLYVMMEHTTREGHPRLVRECTYPLTARACVHRVVTDLAVVDITPQGFLLREVAPGWTPEEVQALTGAPLQVAEDLREMAF